MLNSTQTLRSWKLGKVKKLTHPLCSAEPLTAENHPSSCELDNVQGCPIVYLEGQTPTLQIPILGPVNDSLDSLSPLIRWKKMLVSQTLVQLLSFPQGPELFAELVSLWQRQHKQGQPLLRTGWLRGKEALVYHLIVLPFIPLLHAWFLSDS